MKMNTLLDTINDFLCVTVTMVVDIIIVDLHQDQLLWHVHLCAWGGEGDDG